MGTTIITHRTAADGTVLYVYRWCRSFWVGTRSPSRGWEPCAPSAQFWTIDDALTRLHAELAQRAQAQEDAPHA